MLRTKVPDVMGVKLRSLAATFLLHLRERVFIGAQGKMAIDGRTRTV